MRVIDQLGDLVIFDDREKMYRQVHQNLHFPGNIYLVDIKREVKRLLRRGLIVAEQIEEGAKLTLTEAGRQQVFLDGIGETDYGQTGWDGRWRVVFFDVSDKKKKIRNDIRRYLTWLGYTQYQESVYISPYDRTAEVVRLREILGVVDELKMGELCSLEAEEDLKKQLGIGILKR